MTFIKTITPETAEGRLKSLYERVKGPDGRIDNILMAHSLRPASLEGHMVLYKNVLHNSSNQIPKWFLETIGIYVSMLNRCAYCVEHHFEGLKRLLKEEGKTTAIKNALTAGLKGAAIETPALGVKEIAALKYAEQLTRQPSRINEAIINDMRQSGWDDGKILEINQVAAYFAYANRTVLGLGVSTEGDALGLSPNNSDYENDWGHQ